MCTTLCLLLGAAVSTPDRFDSGIRCGAQVRSAASGGSIPQTDNFDDIAQLVERQAVNLLVVGSNPSIVAIGVWCNGKHAGFWHR